MSLTSQIRNFEISNWTGHLTVQFKISDFGFAMQDSFNFKMSSLTAESSMLMPCDLKTEDSQGGME